MIKKTGIFTAAMLGFSTMSTLVSAHHSPSAYDMDAEVSFVGEVIEYSFRNPHVYLTIEVERDDDSRGEVEVEGGAGSVIAPLGFTRDAVVIGDLVTVYGSPSRRRPDSHIIGKELYKQDGSYYPLHIRSRSNYEAEDATATSIAGTWFSSRESFYGYLGETREQWPLTPKGREFMDNVDYKATPQKDCKPLASPTIMVYPVANTVSIEDDRVIFDIDWLDSKRIVWTDGREHPPAGEKFHFGHSIGHWDGDVLVVDTTNYTANDMGLSLYLAGSEQKHLQERFELSADGKSMIYSGVVTDPEYIEEPMTFSAEWGYRPTMQHSGEVCDLGVAHRFLEE